MITADNKFEVIILQPSMGNARPLYRLILFPLMFVTRQLPNKISILVPQLPRLPLAPFIRTLRLIWILSLSESVLFTLMSWLRLLHSSVCP